ncbi:MAG: FAD-dependent oxidoreductase [Sandaracinaceae bacterium]|nr:FAD-dependent oxidoreductase [Sandaracinaceae bacterium]
MSGSQERGRELAGEEEWRADVVICGGGAGGCMAARELARAGLDVVLLEQGDDQLPHTFTQREDEMIPRMFARAGGQRTADRSMLVLSGHGLGGSTVHNINLCKRTPDAILDRWADEHGLEGVRPGDMAPFFAMVERDLGVRAIDEARMNAHNRLFREGVERLGVRGGMLSHNRDERCIGSGFCELGCAFDAKMNARRVLVPEAIAAGARVVTDARVRRVLLEGSAPPARWRRSRAASSRCARGPCAWRAAPSAPRSSRSRASCPMRTIASGAGCASTPARSWRACSIARWRRGRASRRATSAPSCSTSRPARSGARGSCRASRTPPPPRP